jgi:hypothetical protein
LLLLIAVPVVVLVAFTVSLLQAYAPAYVLVRRVRAARPSFRKAVALVALAFGCVLGVQAMRLAIEAGASGWLYLVVLVLAWDAIKFAVLACLITLRRVALVSRGSPSTSAIGPPLVCATRRVAAVEDMLMEQAEARLHRGVDAGRVCCTIW